MCFLQVVINFFQSDDMSVWSRIEAEEIRKKKIFGAPKGTQNI